MAQVTIDSFAKQIGISIEKLLDQLEQALTGHHRGRVLGRRSALAE